MSETTVFSMGESPSLRFAVQELKMQGVRVVPEMESAVTHILLSVPTGEDVRRIPPDVTVIGGNLDALPDTYSRVDLLREEQYLAENAALTADCALRLLGERLTVCFRDCPILVIGWGRIGKCLAKMLKDLGAQVCVAARKPADLGLLTALGYRTVRVEHIEPGDYRAIINTVPAPVLSADAEPCVKIDLASRRGLEGENVLWARGLPGKMLPESSGKLIARGVMRHLQEG